MKELSRIRAPQYGIGDARSPAKDGQAHDGPRRPREVVIRYKGRLASLGRNRSENGPERDR